MEDRVSSTRRRALIVAIGASALASLVGLALRGHKRRIAAGDDDGPLPVVKDDAAGLVLTYIDEHGDFHVVDKVSEVPEAAKETVRVTDSARALAERGSGDTVFLADLRQKRADGTYPVKRSTRAALEALALARRPSGAGPQAGAAAAPRVVIYGASWCGPCHQAAAYLTQRGVPFVLKDIETEPGASREMQAKLEAAGMRGGSIPVIDVNGTVLVGFNPQSIEAALRH